MTRRPLVALPLAALLALAALTASAEGITREQGDQILTELRALRSAIDGLRAPAAPTPPPPRDLEVSVSGGYVIGRADAPVTLVQFTDYQCPYCARFFRNALPTLREQYIDSGKLKMIVRDLPLEFHEHAAAAAHATRCAGEQGKFMAMHDVLYTNAAKLDPVNFSGYAGAAGLDTKAFDACMKDGRYHEAIAAEARETQALGITGTPTFVLGRERDGKVKGQQILGAQPATVFAAEINRLLGAGT
jgi:protein-disulfide isomerase